MRIFKRKWLSSVLAVFLALGMLVGSMPASAYAQQSDEAEQPEAGIEASPGSTPDAQQPNGSEQPEAGIEASPGSTPDAQQPSGSEQPGTGSKEPADGAADAQQPDGSEQPGTGSEEPADGAADAQQPDGSEQPEAGSEEPADGATDAQQPDGSEQPGTGSEEPADGTEGAPAEGEENSLASNSEDEAKATAVIAAPDQLALDGSKSYVMLFACGCGEHAYGIGADAAATEELGIAIRNCAPGDTVSLSRKGLGWSFIQTENGLIIQNGGHYLTVSDDQQSLVTSETETISGLTIQTNGVLSLAEDANKTVSLQGSASDPEPQPGQRFVITEAENRTAFCFAEVQQQPETGSEEPADGTDGVPAGEEEISLMSIGLEEAQEIAVIAAPNQLALDGSKSYIVFSACAWGGHTYGIGTDAAATERLGIAVKNCAPGETVYLLQKGLGWSFIQAENGLIIQNNGHYLTLSDDQQSLVVSETETISGLAIKEDGSLSLAGDANKTVYLQRTESDPEPQPGQRFMITDGDNRTVFYFAEVQEQPEQPSEEVLFPTLLPQKGFRAEVVAPDKVYGDDQYVIFTKNGDGYAAITSGAGCSSSLAPDKEIAVGTRLSSPDRNVLWTVNNNRGKSAGDGYYKYIRSCASNAYLAKNDALLDENIACDFYFADKDADSALLATEDGQYVTLRGDRFTVTSDKALASRFHFAKLLQEEQQTSGNTATIPAGNLLRLVDWNNIEDGKTYAIISATEFNKLHYALSGNGRLARYDADNLTNHDLCPNENIHDLVYGEPCAADLGDVFYTSGKDILWTASVSEENRVAFKNNQTGLYLKPSDGTAAEQTPSLSKDAFAMTVTPVEGQAYAYLGDGNGRYLGIWQYVIAGVDENARERCAYYLSEVLRTEDANQLPATTLTADADNDTVSFGGMYSVYQGSQHLLTNGTGVETFVLMDDGTGSFRPSSAEYSPENNYYVTYCADYEADMPVFTEPGQYRAVDLRDSTRFTDEQKDALEAIIPNCYPYVSEEEFLSNLKAAGYEVSENCGTDEIMAGVQAVIYTITNPQEEAWGYESSDGWAHQAYEVNKPTSYVSNPAQAENDVNTVRNYLYSLATPTSTLAVPGPGLIEAEGDYFAITTVVDGVTYALTADAIMDWDYSNDTYTIVYGGVSYAPYDPTDFRQAWYMDGEYIRSFPSKALGDTDSFLQIGGMVMDEVYSNGHYAPDGNFTGRLMNGEAYRVALHYSNNHNHEFNLPVTLDQDGHLKIIDPEHRVSDDFYTQYDCLGGFVYPEFGFKSYSWGSKYVNADAVSAVASADGLVFKKEKATPIYPESILFDLESADWKVEYNEDRTAYGVTINGKLNAPVRGDYDDITAYLYCNDILLGEIQVDDQKQTFTVSSEKIIPDDQEAAFRVHIEEKCLDVTVFEPLGPNGWQMQIAGGYTVVFKDIVENTTSIPVRKVWKDDKDHSGDTVQLELMENGKRTGYTLTLSEKNGWQGAFKHVPNRRWTYDRYIDSGTPVEAGEIPLLTHEYTVRETKVRPGYLPEYDIGAAEKLKPHAVQVVYDSPDKGLLAFDHSTAVTGSFSEYRQGEESQRLVLNGDNILLSKVVIPDPDFKGEMYTRLNFEPADAAGKYNVYMEDINPDGTAERTYLPAEFPEQPDASTFTKENAAAFDLYDADTGEKLTGLPENLYRPMQDALEAYVDGVPTGFVLSGTSGIMVEYNADDPSQKLDVYMYGDQPMLIPYPEEGICVEPCGDGSGLYMLTAIDYTGEKLYATINDSGRLTFVEDISRAAQFGWKNGIEQEDTQAFTVYNAPCTYLEISKKVSGTGASESKLFTFTVTLSDRTISGVYGNLAFVDGVGYCTLKHGEKKVIAGLPDGIGYTVVETDNAGYTVTVKQNQNSVQGAQVSGTLKAGELTTLEYNNAKQADPTPKPINPTPRPGQPTDPDLPATGDTSNLALWLVMLALSAAGFIALLLMKRKRG